MTAMSEERAERFTAVYERTYGAIHAYAARRVGVEAADEIAAETFLVAWRRMDALPGDPLPWLYGVARNIVARHRRAGGRQRVTEAALAGERSGTHPSSHDSGDPLLWEAWERLRPGDREVLALIAWEELPVADAARVLGCSAPVFSVRLHRARRRLERLLATASPPPIPATELSEA